MKNMKVKEMTTLGILCAFAIVINLLAIFPLVPAVPWLTYDPKDIITVIGGFIYGPFASFMMSAICSIIEIMIKGGTVLDVLMDVIATCSFACVAAAIYKKKHTKQGAMLALGAGVICMTIAMVFWNYIVTPIYYGMPREAVVALLLPGIIPFNLLKAGLNAGVTLFLYKSIVTILRSTNLVERHDDQAYQKNSYLIIVGFFIIITSLCIILAMQGII